MWSKALTWKRDKAREEEIARKQAIEWKKRHNIRSAIQHSELLYASTTAKELLDYYQKNENNFHTLDKGLIKSEDDSTGVYLLIYNGEVEFYAKYKAILYKKLFTNRMIQQLEFYRLGSSFHSANIPKRILFDYMLPSHRAIVTNTHLTLYEKNIWINALAFALKNLEKYSVFL